MLSAYHGLGTPIFYLLLPNTMHTVTFDSADGIGRICIANPPVNALSRSVMHGLADCLSQFESAPSLQALLIYCAGKTFVAGADITLFDDPTFDASAFNTTLARLESQPRLVVAALHGTALGGGLELALACHYRVAQSGTRLGLPEVKLGLLPGSLGTQRLPRLIGVEPALDMMLSGRMLDTHEALSCALVDTIRDGAPLDIGLTYIRELLAHNAPIRPLSHIRLSNQAHASAIASAMSDAQKQAHYPAKEAIVACVQAAVSESFETGAAIEAKAFKALLNSPTSRALRHLFFAQRVAAKLPQSATSTSSITVESVGILGAGTMGTGIAMCFLSAGIPTVLVDATPEGLQRGIGLIESTYAAHVAKGRLSAEQAQAILQQLTTSLDDTALAECDLVIEAVFENMALKQQVCQRLGQICKLSAIIASNTSTLDVDVLAQATGRPSQVIGMHFFSPAHIMKLLEVIRGAQTAPAVLKTVMEMAKTIGKTAVVSGVCYGFIGNRMAEVYMREAEFLLMEGATPAQIDSAVQALGMAMGPCRMLDMAGIDVGAKTVIEYGKAGGLPPDPSYRAVVQTMFALGRFGQKTGTGYYRYDGRTALPDPETERITAEVAQAHGITRRTDISEQEIVERLLYSLINEGCKILEEGIAYRASDIDVVWTAGYGFPDHQGGPMFLAEQHGLAHIVQRLQHYANIRGNAYGYWDISPLLQRLADQQQGFASLSSV